MNTKSFIRKIIYIVVIGALLIPLSLVSRPTTRNKSGQIADEGGKLAGLRNLYGLSQTRVSEIDPTSETMKLLSLGLRGVAVNLLWLQAMEDKRLENWDQLESTLNALIKIQPNFVKVWEFQAHNLSYNISMEFDDFETRYHWVKKGIRFLTTGLPYNISDHRMTDNLGMFTGMKIGNADEKVQYRRMFRVDTDFHEEMAPYIEPDSYDARQFGHDHWKMAYGWFLQSRKKVEEQSQRPYVTDVVFYMKLPSQLRNQVMSLQKEFRSDETIKEMWASAEREWQLYGKMPLRNSLGIEINLNSMAETNEKIERLREQLDALAPGARDQLVDEVKIAFNLTDEQRAVLNKPVDQRTDEENARARTLNSQISNASDRFDIKVFQKVPVEKQVFARQVLDQILQSRREMQAIDRDQGIANFKYWAQRTMAEAEDLAIDAHQKLFDATELQRKSIFDDEYRIETESNEKMILRRGAISMFVDSFATWAQVFVRYPELQEGDLADNLVDSLKQYRDILKITGFRWPDDFPMQATIDLRAKMAMEDDLPTTEQLEEERSAREDSSSGSQSNDGGKDK